jgi:galactose-1-phosphate uridylyltransferase
MMGEWDADANFPLVDQCYAPRRLDSTQSSDGRAHPFAPDRAAQTRAFLDDARAVTCPFCPGNEHETPPELGHVGEPWRVRTFPNKYPPVAGAEVIVEAAEHEARFEEIGHAADVVAMCVARYGALDDVESGVHECLFIGPTV